MATKNPYQPRRSSPALRIILVLLILVLGAFAYFQKPITGYAQAGTSYAAKNACACRFIGGRDLSSCYDDFLPGMEMVFLRENESARSVTAYVPLIASNRAQYREGQGCVLDPWREPES